MFVSLQFKLELKREDGEKLIKLMRRQSSAPNGIQYAKGVGKIKNKKPTRPNIPKTKTAIS
jgi:hypothetical protein